MDDFIMSTLFTSTCIQSLGSPVGTHVCGQYDVTVSFKIAALQRVGVQYANMRRVGHKNHLPTQPTSLFADWSAYDVQDLALIPAVRKVIPKKTDFPNLIANQ